MMSDSGESTASLFGRERGVNPFLDGGSEHKMEICSEPAVAWVIFADRCKADHPVEVTLVKHGLTPVSFVFQVRTANMARAR